MYYRNLIPNVHRGDFYGYALCEYNSHDMYAVGIYNEKGDLLGYTPKGNKRLNESLREWHNGKTFAWGSLYYDDYNKRWEGIVNIPVGFTAEMLLQLTTVLELIDDNKKNISNKEKETRKYFEILNKHRQIDSLLSELNYPEEIYYSFPKNLIPAISSHLEKEKNWIKLVELEKHPDLISNLNDKFKQTTLRRIKTAKDALNKL